MGKTNTNADIKSGFRDYPQAGFQIQPPSNYWEGNNFIMPGINPGPTMSSDLAERFPGLASILRVPSPPPLGGGPFVGGMPGRGREDGPSAPRNPLQSLLSQIKG
jgi:hypothetical protein